MDRTEENALTDAMLAHQKEAPVHLDLRI
jgi:hypothetical protein